MTKIQKNRPKAFLGSSEQALPLLRHIASVLQRSVPSVEFVLWKDERVWDNLTSALDNLSTNTDKFFYGIFLGYPDDLVIRQGRRSQVRKAYKTRDNVTFEFGLFFTKNDKKRTFYLVPKLSGPAEFNIMSDIGSSDYVIHYPLHSQNTGKELHKFTFNKQQLGAACQDLTRRIVEHETGRANRDPSHIEKELEAWAHQIRADLSDLCDTGMTNLFCNRVGRLIALRSAKSRKRVSDTIEDMLNVLSTIDDVVDLRQLSQEQSKKTVEAVWVLADPPLEFETHSQSPGAELERHFKLLNETIIGNLARGVDYTYFVQTLPENLDAYEKSARARLGRSRRPGKINFFVTDPRYFKTFFTVHWHKKDLSSATVYQSVITRRRADLLFQLKDTHAGRVIDRLKAIKGRCLNEGDAKRLIFTTDFNLVERSR